MMITHRFSLLYPALLLQALLLAGCAGEQKCPFRPSPIFSAGLPRVVQYQFEEQGRYSLESVLFDNGVLLEVEQDICTNSVQDYRFKVMGDYSAYPDSLWLREAVLQFNFLSRLSETHTPLRMWAARIDEVRSDMKLGREAEIAENIFVKVDRIVGPEASTLLVQFAQR
jgi:hypothetical protein